MKRAGNSVMAVRVRTLVVWGALLAAPAAFGGDDTTKGESGSSSDAHAPAAQGESHKSQSGVAKAANQTAEALKGAAQKVGPVISDSVNGARRALGFRDTPSNGHKDANGQSGEKNAAGPATGAQK